MSSLCVINIIFVEHHILLDKMAARLVLKYFVLEHKIFKDKAKLSTFIEFIYLLQFYLCFTLNLIKCNLVNSVGDFKNNNHTKADPRIKRLMSSNL